MTAEPEETFMVAYPCDKHCVVEVDVSDAHSRYTVRQMREKADVEHKRRHGPIAVRTPIHDGLQASFRPPGL